MRRAGSREKTPDQKEARPPSSEDINKIGMRKEKGGNMGAGAKRG